MELPVPQIVSKLRSFLHEQINFYGKFLQNLADTLATLYKLLQKQEKWQWVHHKKRLLIRLKLSSPQPCLLAHFDPAKELILSCDASSFGTGAVLSHQLRMGWRNLLPLPLIPWRLQRGNTHTSRMKVWQSFMGSKGST